jgi:hypothetical protein
MARRHDLRRIKSHLNYTADELAHTLRVNVTTVRVWTAAGLRPLPGTRPYLFAATEIREFLQRRMKPRRKLAPGHLLCVACKEHRTPLGDLVDLTPRGSTAVDLIGECPVCRRTMYRRARRDALHHVVGALKVRYEDAPVPFGERGEPARVPLLEGAAS